jgi:hypothetical protein
MRERDCSEDRVHDKRAGGLAVAHKTTQDVPVPLARLENAGGWLGKPRGNRCFGLGRAYQQIEVNPLVMSSARSAGKPCYLQRLPLRCVR